MRVISGLTARWILDCGASTHVTNGESAVSARIPIEEPSAILTDDGVKQLLDSVIVSIPHIEGFRNAVVVERSPNLASLGKLIMEDGYMIKKWSRSGGLHFEDPQGNLVPTFIEDFVPFLGKDEIGYDAVQHEISSAANEIAVAAFLDGAIGFLEIAGLVEETIARAEGNAAGTAPASAEEAMQLDREGRRIALELVSRR